MTVVSLFFSVAIIVNSISSYSINVPSEMVYGETYRLPKISVDINGETVEAQTVLCKPDGTKTEASSVTLNQAGLYTIDFMYNSKKVAESKSFMVRYPYYVFKSKTSSAEYVNGAGLKIKTQSGVRMDFNEVIDLSDSTSSNVLSG